jgi:hypothetical protein
MHRKCSGRNGTPQRLVSPCQSTLVHVSPRQFNFWTAAAELFTGAAEGVTGFEFDGGVVVVAD